ncbi:MAG TPA: hypothetical protein VFH38_07380 [Jatrophihabitans sp.]|nr:hypothetical protein [Jatrophihabitans sp.]
MTAPHDARTEPDRTRDPAAELARVKAERDAALAKLSRQDRRRKIGGATRRVSVAVLVVLVAILVPVTATITWVRHTVLNTNGYLATVAPLASNPAVTEAVARTATDQLFTALNPEPIIADALPPRAAFLAGPITNGVEGFVRDQAANALASPAFTQIWTTANRVAHEALLKVLNGQAAALQTTDGQVVLNLVPLLNNVLAAVQARASDIVGKDVTLPRITGNELPSVACEKISAALNRPLPKTCGQIPLFPAAKLTQAQHAVRLFKHLVVALLIATPLLAALALWLSRRRRRTLMQMTVGVMLGMVVVRRAVIWLENTVIATGKPENKDARSAIMQQVLHGFFDVSLWVLWLALAVLVVAAITGPYRWAVALRARSRDLGGNVVAWTRVGLGHARGAAGSDWIPAHLDALRIAGAGLALVLLLAFGLSWVGLIVILALLAVYEFWLWRIGLAARPHRHAHS